MRRKVLIGLAVVSLLLTACAPKATGSWWLEIRTVGARPTPVHRIPFQVTPEGTLVPGQGNWYMRHELPETDYYMRIDGLVTFQGTYEKGDFYVTGVNLVGPFICTLERCDQAGRNCEEIADSTRPLEQCGLIAQARLTSEQAHYVNLSFLATQGAEPQEPIRARDGETGAGPLGQISVHQTDISSVEAH